MKQSIIQSALVKIQKNKRHAEEEYEKTIAPLLQNDEYQKLNKKLTQLVIEKARAEAYNENAQNLTTEIKNLEQKIDELKKKYSLQDVNPDYKCNKCKDEGYINGQMCSCLKKEISNTILQGSGFEKLENFEDAIKTSGNLHDTYALMQKWCKSDFKKNLIYLAGATGVGKTYLMRCMANELISRGRLVKITTAYQMNRDFKEFSKTNNEELLKNYTDTEILFIDDLGTEPLFKDVTIENLYIVINERKMKKLPTIITSNLTLDNIRDRYDERIFSRIVDRETSITLLLDGEDKRIKK